ncbi:MAG: hypothetical protein ACKOCA_02540 [Vulcanococcus sp.]
MTRRLNLSQHNLLALMRAWLSQRWEPLFFLVLFCLLSLQVFLFIGGTLAVSTTVGGGVAAFAAFELFVARDLSSVTVPLIALPLLLLVLSGRKPHWLRRYLDAVGIYVVVRMLIQLFGLNLLVFDSVTPRFTLITQLLFFLPYSLLVWGWVYWRLNAVAGVGKSQWFRLDCEHETPRPIDYILASFASVFSASISSIKGRSARAKALILIHGFFVYDLMGLTLSRAVALIQSR